MMHGSDGVQASSIHATTTTPTTDAAPLVRLCRINPDLTSPGHDDKDPPHHYWTNMVAHVADHVCSYMPYSSGNPLLTIQNHILVSLPDHPPISCGEDSPSLANYSIALKLSSSRLLAPQLSSCGFFLSMCKLNQGLCLSLQQNLPCFTS